MDLDDFKQAWQAPTDAAATDTLDAGRIRELLRGRSHSALARLRRNMLFEAVSSMVALALTLYLFWGADTRLRVLLGLLAVYCLGFAVALLYYRRRLGTGPDPALSVKEQLRATVALTADYLQTYQRSLVWLTISGLALGLGVGAVLGSRHHAPKPLPVERWQVLLWAGATLVAAYFITLWIYRFALRMMYGRHLDAMRACLAELDE